MLFRSAHGGVRHRGCHHLRVQPDSGCRIRGIYQLIMVADEVHDTGRNADRNPSRLLEPDYRSTLRNSAESPDA